MRRMAGLGIPVTALFTLLWLFGALSGAAIAAQKEPERFFLDFFDGHLIFVPEGGSVQIFAAGQLLSSGADWETAKLKPFLYDLRLKTWKDFFWRVDTRDKHVRDVTFGTFGDLGGNQRGKPFKVEVVGGDGDKPPDRIILHFRTSNLIHVLKDGTLQIRAEGAELSPGSDWEAVKLKPYLYHLRLKTWDGIFWKVNTDWKRVWKVEKGTFGQPGGNDTELKIEVRIVEGH